MTEVVVTATGSIPRAQVDAAREHVTSASGTMPVDAAGAVAERLIGNWPAHPAPPR